MNHTFLKHWMKDADDALRENCVSTFGYRCGKPGTHFNIDADNFPQSIVNKYKDDDCFMIDPAAILPKTAKVYKKLEMSEYTGEKDWGDDKKSRKIVTKAFVKAVKKYLDKCANGYEPEENLSDNMERYIAKKMAKYAEKGFTKYIEKIKAAEAAKTEEPKTEEPDKEEDSPELDDR